MNPAIVSLIIFAVCVVLFIWNKLPSSLVALMGLSAMILTGCCDFSQGFKNFSSSIIVLICSMMVVGKAAFDTGLAELVGNKVIALAHGNERLIVVLSTLVTAIISAVLSNIATLAIMISIMTSVCSSNSKVKFKNVIMPVSMAAVIGGSATLVGSTTQLTAQGILELYIGEGNGFTFGTFIIPGIVIIATLVIYTGFVGYPLGNKIWGSSPEYNASPTDNGENTKAATENTVTDSNGNIIVMAVIFVLTIVLFATADLVAKLIPGFNLAMVSVLSAIACVLTGCVTHTNAIKAINWNLAIWFCSSLGIAEGLNVSGGGELMAKTFLKFLGEDIQPFTLFAALVIFVIVLTQFLSNSTVLTIALPIALPLCTQYGYNQFSFAVGMTIAAAMAVVTPLANTTIGMSMIAKYRFSDYFKYAGLITLINILIILIIVPALWPLA